MRRSGWALQRAQFPLVLEWARSLMRHAGPRMKTLHCDSSLPVHGQGRVRRRAAGSVGIGFGGLVALGTAARCGGQVAVGRQGVAEFVNQQLRGARPSSSTDPRAVWASVSVALAVLLGLQCERTFVSTMIFVVDQSNRVELARNAILVISAMALAALLARIAGLRNAIVVSALLLAGSRLLLQFVSDPELRWPLAAVGFVGFGWLLATLVPVSRNALALGLALGLWLDLIVRAAFGSIDLPSMTNGTKDAVSVLLVVMLLVAISRLSKRIELTEQGMLGSFTLLGIGAGIGTYAIATGNLGIVVARAGTSIQGALIVLSIGPAIALALWLWPIGRARTRPRPAGALAASVAFGSALGLAALVVIAKEASDEIALSVALVLVAFLTTYLMMLAAAGRSAPQSHSGLWRTAGFVTAGLLIHAATVFLYFASSGSFVYAIVAFGVLALAGAVAAQRPSGARLATLRGAAVPPAALAVGFVVALVVAGGGSQRSEPVALEADLTVVTYNIQNGFSRENRWDLEAIATTIEGLKPDVVLLQEVGRGWFALGWADQAGWLSDRLDMEMAFGAASGDDLWGNAILSTAPLLEAEVVKYSSTQNLRRGLVSATLPFAGGEAWVASTHLDNPSDAGQVRIDQVTQLLGVWDGVTPAVIGGDFNMTPGEDAIALIESAGFAAASSATGNTDGTSESGKKIDYVFVTPDVETISVLVPDIWTSDHRPVAADLRLRLE